MDPAASAVTPPPPPPGFVPATAAPAPAAPSTPPPPPGFVPSMPVQPPPPPAPPQTTGLMGHIANLLGDTSDAQTQTQKGVIKGGMNSIAGAIELVNRDDQPDPQGDIMRAANHVAPRVPDPQGHIHALDSAAKWLRAHAQTHNVWEQLGEGGESAAEFLVPGLGEESATKDLAEAPTYGEKLSEAAKTASFLEKTPMGQKLARLAAIGARTVKAAIASGAKGAVEGAAGGAAQTYVKTGGDEEATKTAAEYGAAGGGILGASAESVAGLWAAGKYSAAIALARLARPSLTVDAIGDAAREITAARMGETNATRMTAPPPKPGTADAFTFDIGGTPTTSTVEGHIAQDARKVQVGSVAKPGKGPASGVPPYDPADMRHVEFGGDDGTQATYRRPDPHENVGRDTQGNPSYPDAAGNTTDPAITDDQGSHKEAVFQYLPESRPGSGPPARDVASGGGRLFTRDPKVAGAQLGSLNEIINGEDFAQMAPEQQQQLTAARDDIKDQLAQYREFGKANGLIPANFQPVDAEAAIRASGDLQEASEQIAAPAREVYEHANNVSGGRWQALKDHIEALGEKLDKEPYAEGRAAIQKDIARARNSMTDILQDPKAGFDTGDIDQAVRNFRTSYILQDAHEAIKPIYAVESKDGSVTGAYRGINGPMVAQRFDAFLKANPDAVELMGADRVNTIKQILHTNETMAARKRFGAAVLNVASALAGLHFGGLKGALEGGATSAGVRYVLNSSIGNPKIAKNLLYAIDAGARPENYSPHIAKMIMQGARADGTASGE